VLEFKHFSGKNVLDILPLHLDSNSGFGVRFFDHTIVLF